jgi:hypothetical protein
MSKNLKEQYFGKANNLMERMMDEAPEDVAPVDTGEETPAVGGDENPPEDAAPEEETPEDEEKGQSAQVEIFFDSLDEETQKVLLDALKETLNVTEDDNFANQKIIDALSKEPLISLRAEELVRKLNIEL